MLGVYVEHPIIRFRSVVCVDLMSEDVSMARRLETVKKFKCTQKHFILLLVLKKHKSISARRCYWDSNIKAHLLCACPVEITLLLFPFHGNLSSQIGYFSDEDRGLIWHIGTRGGSSKWSNPAKDSIQVSVGALDPLTHTEKRNLKNVNSRAPYFPTLRRVSENGNWILGSNQAHPYFQIDLGLGRSVEPSMYQILDGNAGSPFRTWELQGSMDGKSWFVLRKHVDDMKQRLNSTKGTWRLNPGHIRSLRQSMKGHSALPSVVSKRLSEKRMPAVRFFRIVKDRMGTIGTWFLGISGFEVYGKYKFAHMHVRY